MKECWFILQSVNQKFQYRPGDDPTIRSGDAVFKEGAVNFGNQSAAYWKNPHRYLTATTRTQMHRISLMIRSGMYFWQRAPR